VAMKKIQALDRLAERNLIKDFFEDLAARRLGPALEGRAARVGCDLDQPHVVLAADGADEQLESALAAAVRDALLDRREQSLRALLPVPAAGQERLVESIRGAYREIGSQAVVGLSSVGSGQEAVADAFEEARHALLGAAVLRRQPGVVTYDELGPYKYLLRIALDAGVRDATVDAVSLLADYDRERGASLLATLEEFLSRRGNITTTSEALFVHANTLRQRLRRVGEISGIDLRRDDWLMIEIAVKMVRLRAALDQASPNT
jgi:DNA-binding PucR family transcriptional regulator